ncbi:hypothetical protein B0T11DRAFT_290689 [Plectosphaerella cucumerina]|uniref:Uncharacterized protein n=1 Tax=Plectosphaerella cucumerina TaxID=40658 RepID=A0A8K0X0E4_9PEZI|nr:hypothetical protein B0T11DRAFT_290689 [Plectosphaerella cucumerina]
MVIFMFYGMYSMAMHGFCIEFPTLAQLPVWTSPESWKSENAHLGELRKDKDNRTLSYEAYTRSWAESPPSTLDTFDKFLIVPCKGLESMAGYDLQCP